MSHTFEKGLALFAERASLKDLYEAAEFARVVPSTVLSWIKGPPPLGEAQLRMMHYLNAKGIQVEGLDTLPRPAFRLGGYIFAGAIEIDEAANELGYATIKDLYRLLRGAELTSVRAEKLNELLDKYHDKFVEAAAGIVIYPFAEGKEPVPVAAEVSTSAAPATVPFAVEHTAGTLLSATALVEALILTDETQLATVGTLVGKDRISDLVSYLDKLT